MSLSLLIRWSPFLSIRGYRARAAYDAQEAIDRASDFHPDALIADVVLPGIDGRALAAHFAVSYPECKVMLMSDDLSAGSLLLSFIFSRVVPG
jgi:CheY-like chemotaxis protein